MYVIVGTEKPKDKKLIGCITAEGIQLPPCCPNCKNPVALEVKGRKFLGAQCPDCGETYQLLGYGDTVGDLILPFILEPEEEAEWLPSRL